VSLSRRAQKVLAAILLLPEGKDGWRRATYRDQLHETAGVARATAALAVKELEADGCIERQRNGRSARAPEGFKVAEKGAHAAQVRPHGAALVRTMRTSEPVFDSSSSPQVGTEKEEEPREAHEPHDAVRPSPHGAVRPHEVIHRHFLEPSPALSAMFEAFLAQRDVKPANAPAEPDAEREQPTNDPRPAPDHPPPECCGSPMKLTRGSRGWFWGCPLWERTGCRGLSLEAARALWFKAQAAEEAERKKEEARAQQERERITILNDPRPSPLDDVEPGQFSRLSAVTARVSRGVEKNGRTG
jgi:hypothetical protein